MAIEDDKLWDLLRSLNDPERAEFPVGYDHRQETNRFNQLVDRLDAAFSCACWAGGFPQDRSYHGRIDMPAEATATWERLVVLVSNFGGLAIVAIENPCAYTPRGVHRATPS